MSTDTQETEDLETEVTNFLRRNFPQIQMHGGTAAVENVDPESGTVSIRLGGACSGCGISPMTVQAIKSRMVEEIPEIEKVEANAGGGGGSFGPSPYPDVGDDTEDTEDDGSPSAPF
ncbi:NifU family protein [Salinarchaeum sp. IM2453]|uniref:NifU family protein n=1 Tax=Salinarchaeum sp. IM2453 TaxID=2862870 RepID=UPI001C831B06|nr:NifU family protein [Salinarchaeum sp. IM2453]QZA89299.1 NifU family protein [Salinarchaeum sp. IM2453]